MNAHARLTSVADVLAEHDDVEAWRPALIAYYRVELNPHREAKLIAGEPMDWVDAWALKSIKAAVAAAPVLA